MIKTVCKCDPPQNTPRRNHARYEARGWTRQPRRTCQTRASEDSNCRRATAVATATTLCAAADMWPPTETPHASSPSTSSAVASRTIAKRCVWGGHCGTTDMKRRATATAQACSKTCVRATIPNQPTTHQPACAAEANTYFKQRATRGQNSPPASRRVRFPTDSASPVSPTYLQNICQGGEMYNRRCDDGVPECRARGEHACRLQAPRGSPRRWRCK